MTELVPSAGVPRSVVLERIAAEIRAQEEESRKSARLAIGHKINVGKLLLEAKEKLPRGDFGVWAQRNFGWHRNHVARHIKLARNATRVLQSVGAEASLRMGLAALRPAFAEASAGKPDSHLWRLVGEAEWDGEGEPTAEQLLEQVQRWRVQRVAA